MLTRILADNAETYNAALEERIGAWKLQRKSINYRDQQSELTELRKDPAFQTGILRLQRRRCPLAPAAIEYRLALPSPRVPSLG